MVYVYTAVHIRRGKIDEDCGMVFTTSDRMNKLDEESMADDKRR